MISGNDVALAYMTAEELERHVQTVMIRDTNTVRALILEALLDNTNATFADPIWGSLTIRRLANNDGTLYPPLIGATAEAEHNHYLTLGAASISSTNNPFPTLRNHITHHFGNMDVIVFNNPDETNSITSLPGFVPAPDRYVIPGDSESRATNIPQDVPGIILGRMNGAWVAEWEYVPSGYLLAVARDRKPLLERIDPPETGLRSGLQLVARDREFPFENAIWRHRMGFGVGNRLAAVAMQITTGSTYSAPTVW